VSDGDSLVRSPPSSLGRGTQWRGGRHRRTSS